MGPSGLQSAESQWLSWQLAAKE